MRWLIAVLLLLQPLPSLAVDESLPRVRGIVLASTVSSGTAMPLADARVEVFRVSSNYQMLSRLLAGTRDTPVAHVQSGQDGRFELALPPGVYQGVVDAPGYVPMLYFLLPVTDTVELPPVSLLPDAGLQVTVRDSQGAPVAAASVFSQTASRDLWRGYVGHGWRQQDRIGRTDEAGSITLAVAAGEQLDLSVLPIGHLEPTQLRVAGRTVAMTVPATPAVSRSLQVRTADGAPVGEVLVALGSWAQPAGKTDEAGLFHLPAHFTEAAVEAKAYLFTAGGRRLEFQLETATVSASASTAPISTTVPQVVTLPAQTAIRGKVMSADRRVLPGAVVWPGSDPGQFVYADQQGVFELTAAAVEGSWLQAGAPGHLPRIVRPQRAADGWQSPTISLLAGSWLTGRVTDADGQPLNGVQVAVRIADGEQRPPAFQPDRVDRRSVSDAAGGFTLAALHPAAGYILSAAKPGFASTSVTVGNLARSAAERRVQLQLLPARAAFGQVVDSQDQPVLGAEIRVVDATHPELLLVAGRSTADGRFELPELPAGWVDIEVRAEGFPPMSLRGLEVPAGSEALDLGVLVLTEGVRLAGRVETEDEEPIAGARVVAMPAAEDSVKSLSNRLLSSRPVETDARGRFELTDLLAGQRVYVVVSHEGYQNGLLAGVEVPASEAVTVVLKPASRIVGRVEDEDGVPVAGARVALSGLGPAPGTVGVRRDGDDNSQTVQTDPAGEFELVGVIPGTVKLSVLADDYQPPEPQVLKVAADQPTDEVVLVVQRGAVLAGTVRDAQGEPIADARLTIGAFLARSDADGKYRIGGLASGAQSLEVRHKGYNRLQRDVEIEPAPEVNEVDLVLAGGTAVSGWVINGDGEPVAGARVWLEARQRRDSHEYRVLSAADGSFQVAGVATGRYQVEAVRAGFAAGELAGGLDVASEPVTEVELVLRPGAEIVGRVLGLEFEDLAAVEVEAQLGDRTPVAAVVDFEGGFRFADLAVGDWRLRATLQGGTRQAEARVAIGPDTQKVQRDLQLGGGLELSGQVIFGGEPLPRTWVAVRGLTVDVERSVTTDYEGRFRLLDLAAGPYRLSLSNSQATVVHNEDLELLSDRDVIIDVATARVSGVVRAADSGQPKSDAMVYLQQMHGEQPGSMITVATGPDGSFELANVSRGHFRLRITADGFSPNEQSFDIEPGLDVGPLDLTLEATAGLDLRLQMAEGGPPEWATVSVFDEAGQHRLTESRRVDGAGRVRFVHVPEGSWQVRVESLGRVAAWRGVTIPGPVVELSLERAARMQVRVPALVESNLLATVAITGGDGRLFEALGPGGSMRSQWDVRGGTATLEGLPPGQWMVEVIAVDGQRWQAATVADPGAELHVRLD